MSSYMTCIVPLAGPDFVRQGGLTKAEISLWGAPLLLQTLRSRPWVRAGLLKPSDLVFVLQDRSETRRFASQCLDEWFPGCATVFIRNLTAGAAYSVLCGSGLSSAPRVPLCIDLADIFYTCTDTVVEHFVNRPEIGAIGLSFLADDPSYSYFECDENGMVLKSREKQIISLHASAGTYWYRDVPTLLQGISHSIYNAETLSYNGMLFVCPTFDGVVAAGHTVILVEVNDVFDIKNNVHNLRKKIR